MFLWKEAASSGERRFAIAAIVVSTVVFLALAPFAKVPLGVVPAFIPTYESALVINDLMTAIFLLGQFHTSRSNALLVLACGYLFTASIAIVHLLTFPGVFLPTGLLGAGTQTTAWLYMAWHAAFPLFVIAYACREEREQRKRRVTILQSVAAVLVAVFGLTLMTTAGHALLPVLIENDRFTSTMFVVVCCVWALSFLALAMLWRRRTESVFDIWLAVVMCSWIFDIALSAVLNESRYDLGFYAGRIYGLVAASFVLVVLLFENSKLYSQILLLRESEQQQAAELRRLSVVDGLTGIANRRAFDEALDQEWRRTMRHNTGLSLLLIDVDFFKRFNDTYGHVAGDRCLQAVAQAIAGRARRAGELAARYGGEEFAMLLPHTDIEAACRLADQVREAVCDQKIPHGGSEVASHVTISIGVASASSCIGHSSFREGMTPRTEATLLVKVADQALYRAKTTGRNRVVAANSGDALSAQEAAVDHAA